MSRKCIGAYYVFAAIFPIFLGRSPINMCSQFATVPYQILNNIPLVWLVDCDWMLALKTGCLWNNGKGWSTTYWQILTPSPKSYFFFFPSIRLRQQNDLADSTPRIGNLISQLLPWCKEYRLPRLPATACLQTRTVEARKQHLTRANDGISRLGCYQRGEKKPAQSWPFASKDDCRAEGRWNAADGLKCLLCLCLFGGANLQRWLKWPLIGKK